MHSEEEQEREREERGAVLQFVSVVGDKQCGGAACPAACVPSTAHKTPTSSVGISVSKRQPHAYKCSMQINIHIYTHTGVHSLIH